MSRERARRVNRLLAVIREDVAAQERIAALLEDQEASVRQPASAAFHKATSELSAELGRSSRRKAKRDAALKELAAELGISARRAMTLGSAIERLGDDGAALDVERRRLHELGEQVRQRGRRVAALVRMHRQVTRDLIQVVLGEEEGVDVRSGGSLIDAEA